jgi:hypothetical protein
VHLSIIKFLFYLDELGELFGEKRYYYIFSIFSKSLNLAFHSFRDTQILTTMRFALHVCISILLGLVYWQIGDDANEIFNNSGMIFFSLIFILYVAMMPTFLTCKSIIYINQTSNNI